MEASWLSLIMIYGNSSCCGYDRDTSSTTEFENNFKKKCGFTIYLWFVKLFICVKFYTKGERVLQLCYATCYNIITNALRHYDFISVPPQLELRLGPAVNPRDLEEGDDVYFEWGDDGDGDFFWVRRRWKMRKIIMRILITMTTMTSTECLFPFRCHIRAHPPAYKVTWRHNVSLPIIIIPSP